MADEIKCWVNVDKSSGEGDESFHIIYDKNESEDPQTAVIEVVSEDGTIIKEIKIKQDGRPVYRSIRKERQFTRNDCAANEKGTSILYVVPAGKYLSYISQEDADSKADQDIQLNGQAYANQEGECNVYIWYNKEISKVFTRNNCDEGSTGSDVGYVVEAGKHSSLISQEDADAKAEKDLNDNGQSYANEHGRCSGTYYNIRKSGNFQKNDCTEGTGSFVEYVVEAGTITSEISQEDADRLAQEKVDREGQAYANEHGECTFGFYSKKIEVRLQKNDCSEGEGEFGVYEVPAGKYTSDISQEDADSKAQKEADEKAQAWVNENMGCIITYLSTEKRQSFTKNDCTAGMKGTTVEYVVEAGSYTSTVSQADADAKADKDIADNGQAYANEHGECLDIFVSKEISRVFRKECSNGMIGSEVTYTVKAGQYASDISQEDADRQAEDDVRENGQSYANKNGKCLYGNDAMSEEFQKECPSGQKGSTVVYEVAANTFTSEESKAAANALAQDDIERNGQAHANQNGTCVDMFTNVRKTKDFQKECSDGMVGTTVTYVVEAGKYSSDVSQSDADAKAEKDLNENGQAYANKNGTCLYGNVRKSKKFTKVCPEGQRGTEVEYVVEAKKHTSSISQADADQKADNDINQNGQNYANEHGTCNTIYYNVRKSKMFTRNNCASGQAGGEVEYIVEAGRYDSVVSQAEADAKADQDIAENGQNYANEHGKCLYLSAAKSGVFYKNNCGSCKHGVAYTFSVEAGRFTSEVSQADADSKAQDFINTNGQDQANKNGSCADDDSTPTWTNTGNTQCNGCTSQIQQRDTNPCSSSYNSTRWIDGGSRDCSDWQYYGSGDCVGHTQYDAYRDGCSGVINRQYSVNCNNCCDCGISEPTSDFRCSGTTKQQKFVDDCGNVTWSTYELNSEECGGCTWAKTGQTRCTTGTSQEEWKCGSNTEWRTGGTACTATNSERKCKSGCECETCVEVGAVSASGSTLTEAQNSANANAQKQADGMTCGTDCYVFEFSDGTTSKKVELSCIGDVSRNAIVSSVNGAMCPASAVFYPDWMSGNITGDRVSVNRVFGVQATDNPGSSRTGIATATQEGSGKILTIMVTQKSKMYLSGTIVITRTTANSVNIQYNIEGEIDRNIHLGVLFNNNGMSHVSKSIEIDHTVRFNSGTISGYTEPGITTDRYYVATDIDKINDYHDGSSVCYDCSGVKIS